MFLIRIPKVSKEALEKLWDAWERLKTLEAGDKKSSIKTLLDKAAPHQLCARLSRRLPNVQPLPVTI